jgi:YbbR domain-containing protein
LESEVTMREILNRNFSLKIISVISAMLFWIVVFNMDNEFVDKRVTVSLEVINQDVLEEKGIVLLSDIPSTIELTVRGRENAFSDVTPEKFKVVVDLGTIESADVTRLTVKEPVFSIKDVYVSKYDKYLDVRLERLISREFPINVRTIGTPAEGYSVIGISQNPKTMELRGLESVINRIGSVEAVVDLNGIKEDISMERLCKVYDNKGSIIQSDGYLSVEDIKAKVDLKIGKTVNVIPAVTGSPAEDFYVSGKQSLPGSVVVTGPAELIDSLREVYTEPVNVDGKAGGFEQRAGVNLPKGVRLVEPEGGVVVSVEIERMIEREYRLTKNSVELVRANTDGSYHYEVVDNIIVARVKGRREDVDNLRHGDIRLIADVYGLQDGLHGIPLKVVLPDKYSLVSVDSVIIKIERFKSIALNPEEIAITNMDENYEYTILSRGLKLIFRGTAADLNNMTSKSIKPYINVEGLDQGIGTVPLLMEIPHGVIQVNEISIDVRVDNVASGGSTESYEP